jgi:chromosome segregation ATPase
MYNQQQSQQAQQTQQDIQQLISRFSLKENQYQEQVNLLRGKMGKYEEYLKTLMDKYAELKEDRDLLKERFKQNNLGGNDTGNKYILDTIEEKKRELIRMSNDVQEKITRLEQLQENSNN